MNTEKQSLPLVSIITATIGRDHLARCIKSVKAQTYPNIQHFIVIDGKEREANALKVLAQFEETEVSSAGPEKSLNGIDVLCLPYPTRAYGGRIYASSPHLTRGDFIMNLDDDNTIEPNHVESLLEAIGSYPWAYALRNLTKNGEFVMRDDCASLGPLHPIWNKSKRGQNETFIDTNCYLFRRSTSIELSPNWASVHFEANPYHNDRAFYSILFQRYPNHACTLKHTLNYEVDKEDQWEYITNGNQWIYDRYGKDLPWRSASLASSFRHHGIFESESRDGLYFDESLANAIIALFPARPASVADAGCGPGYYCAHFTEHANWDVQGYEGNPKAKSHGIWDRIEQRDLAVLDLGLPTYELVLSLEVGEHIPKEFESNFLDNLALMTGKTIILSWAVKGQGGTGHFNEQNNPYIISQMEARGFMYNPNPSTLLREASSLGWFKNTIMVFDRIGPTIPRSGSLADITRAEALASNFPTPENFLDLSLAYYNATRFNDCVTAARKAAALKPDFPDAYNNIAAGFIGMSKWDSAIAAATEALGLNPDYPLAKNNLASAIEGRKTQDENISKLEKAASEQPTPENFLDLSAACNKASQYERSIAAARKAIVLRPDYAAAYNNICAANNNLGNFAEGKKAGEEALRLQPDNQLAKNNLKWSLDELNKKNQ